MAMKVRYTVIDGEVVSELRGGVKRDYVPDPLGSTIALLDNTQTRTDTFEYWPYGESAARTGTTATPFRYIGVVGYYLDSTSRIYVRSRYLNTTSGRWLMEDTMGFYGGDFNLYRYVSNRVLSAVDPLGTKKQDCLECDEAYNRRKTIQDHKNLCIDGCKTVKINEIVSPTPVVAGWLIGCFCRFITPTYNNCVQCVLHYCVSDFPGQPIYQTMCFTAGRARCAIRTLESA